MLGPVISQGRQHHRILVLQTTQGTPASPVTYFPCGCDHAVLGPRRDQPPEGLAGLCRAPQALGLGLGGGVLQGGLQSLRQSDQRLPRRPEVRQGELGCRQRHGDLGHKQTETGASGTCCARAPLPTAQLFTTLPMTGTRRQ